MRVNDLIVIVNKLQFLDMVHSVLSNDMMIVDVNIS